MKKVLVYVGLIVALMFIGKVTCYAAEAPAEMVEALNEMVEEIEESGRYERIELSINENDEETWLAVIAFDDAWLGVDYKLVLTADKYGEVYYELVESNAGAGWKTLYRYSDAEGLGWYLY